MSPSFGSILYAHQTILILVKLLLIQKPSRKSRVGQKAGQYGILEMISESLSKNDPNWMKLGTQAL